MKTSYYTGHEDLDKKLSNLYDMQTELERLQSDGTITDEQQRRYQAVIRRQDYLLKKGEERDSMIVDIEQ